MCQTVVGLDVWLGMAQKKRSYLEQLGSTAQAKTKKKKKKECNGRPFVLTIDKTQFVLAKLRIAAL